MGKTIEKFKVAKEKKIKYFGPLCGNKFREYWWKSLKMFKSEWRVNFGLDRICLRMTR